MEFLNEYIYMETYRDNQVSETTCWASQDEQHYYLKYTLLDSECLFDFSQVSNVVEIRIEKTYFEKYEHNFDLFIEKQSICCNTQSKLYELITCKFGGFARKVFLESIVLHLVFQIQKNNLVFQLNCDTCSFVNTQLELDKIQLVKDYIHQHLDQNITIPILASKVGTNQCYLKKGFKEVTGQTLFEYLKDARMLKAKQLLQESNSVVMEVASKVGYNSLSSFSQSYKNYFGISPKMDQVDIFPEY